ncbi:MAG: D-aminoacyl-tRNA deacylase [Desulfocapsaceae bacterium]|nr:D-aminoacyl-tRNA deacylase [Desulfocapsaceae bacterium]
MRAVIQRVRHGSVTVSDRVIGEIGPGILVFLGIHPADGDAEIDWMVDKIANLRIFEDDSGTMNLSLFDLDKEMLIVSQFTLYADCRKGRRPGFSAAASPDIAEPLFRRFIEKVEKSGIRAAFGQFGAMMDVQLVNDGPVTLLLDSDKTF